MSHALALITEQMGVPLEHGDSAAVSFTEFNGGWCGTAIRTQQPQQHPRQ